MTPLFPLIAFLLALAGTQRSLGWGFVAVLAVGYFNGVIRANFLSVYTTFMFDAAVLGLYVAGLLGRDGSGLGTGAGEQFALFLIAWPVLMALVPVNDFLVQLVAVRATVWFLPVMILARRLTVHDLDVIARGLAVLNLCALAGGLYVYRSGVGSLYPVNAVTEIIYKSKDVAGSEYYRIPSTFLNAHAYGGAMLFSLPFLIDRAFGGRGGKLDRLLAIAGVVAALAGILMCAARSPVVVFVTATIVAWLAARMSPLIGVLGVGVLAAALLIAATDQRLQRAITLENTEAVATRVQGSVNSSFLALLADYPAGAGMGSSAGTSIPYFLADRAPVPVGLENEYSRILVDQGWVGLLAWLAFLVWLFHRPPPVRLGVPWGLGVVLMYSLTLTNWATAFIGSGSLSAIPMSVMLLIQMGILIRVREVQAAWAAVTPRVAS
jgi:hypothetical protein